jgi:hypothetical protein
MSSSTIWELGLGDEIISTIRETGYEFPWTYGELADPTKFDRFRVYFGPDVDWPGATDFDALLTEIEDKGGFWLRNTTTGERLNDVFPINHDGGTGVWFRAHR